MNRIYKLFQFMFTYLNQSAAIARTRLSVPKTRTVTRGVLLVGINSQAQIKPTKTRLDIPTPIIKTVT